MSRRHVLCVLFLFVLPFAVFRYGHFRFGVEGAQSGDHRALMRLNDESATQPEFFWKAANFPHYHGAAISLLFRPLMGTVLALEDSLFRSNFFVLGAVSLLITGLVASLLFLLISRVLPWWGALIGASVFVVHYCGSEMIVWRHITPYVFGLVFYVLGLSALLRDRWKLAALCFLLAPLFHETYVIAVFCLGVILSFEKGRQFLGLKGPRIAWCFFVPVLCFVLLDVVTFLFIGMAPTSHHVESNFFKLSFVQYAAKWLDGFLLLVGASLTEFLIPQTFSMTLADRRLGLLVAGPLTLVLMGWVLYRVYKKETKQILFLYVGMALPILALFLVFTTFRLIPLGSGNIGATHYYRYISNFLFVILFAILLGRLPANRAVRTSLVIVAFIIVANQLFFSIVRAHRRGLLTDPWERRVALNLRSASKALGSQRCFLRNETPALETYLPAEFLARQSCKRFPQMTPVTGEMLQNEGIVIAAPFAR